MLDQTNFSGLLIVSDFYGYLSKDDKDKIEEFVREELIAYKLTDNEDEMVFSVDAKNSNELKNLIDITEKIAKKYKTGVTLKPEKMNIKFNW